MQKILVSGVKPTGRPHIGNYFGAMKQFVDLQEGHEAYIFVANYHALTTEQDAKILSQNTLDIVMDYLAIGLDPKRTTIFLQSDVPQVTELAWIFNCMTTVPYLSRAHAYKDALAKNKEPNVGLFDYPILMAADILIQDADVVPVGQDQKQHVEIARDTAEKFNRVYGETFKLPEPMILPDVETVPGIDGRKMSKSYGNTIPLFARDEEIKKAVMGIVTDSGSDIPKNVHAIHKLFLPKVELDALYEEKKGRYKDLKERLIEDIIKFIAPLRERREKIAAKPEKIVKMLEKSGKVVRARAEKKMGEIRIKVGLNNS